MWGWGEEGVLDDTLLWLTRGKGRTEAQIQVSLQSSLIQCSREKATEATGLITGVVVLSFSH